MVQEISIDKYYKSATMWKFPAIQCIWKFKAKKQNQTALSESEVLAHFLPETAK